MVISLKIGTRFSPPESGGQHDRDEVEIVRGVVPSHTLECLPGNHPSRDTSCRAAPDSGGLKSRPSFQIEPPFQFPGLTPANLINAPSVVWAAFSPRRKSASENVENTS